MRRVFFLLVEIKRYRFMENLLMIGKKLDKYRDLVFGSCQVVDCDCLSVMVVKNRFMGVDEVEEYAGQVMVDSSCREGYMLTFIDKVAWNTDTDELDLWVAYLFVGYSVSSESGWRKIGRFDENHFSKFKVVT
jgi:hypothetical protein